MNIDHLASASEQIQASARAAAYSIEVACAEIAESFTAPHITMKPTLSADGDMWCALYGENLQEGVAGFGKTPQEAMAAFDKEWRTSITPIAAIAARQGEGGEQ